MAKRNGWGLINFNLKDSVIAEDHRAQTPINILGEQEIVIEEERPQTPTRGERVQPVSGTFWDHSGTITTANQSQLVMKENPKRRYLLIQNVSNGTLWVNFTLAAQQAQPSIQLVSGGSYVLESSFVSSEAVYIIGAVAGATYVAKEA